MNTDLPILHNMTKKVLAVLPARYASTRLPGKPLLPIGHRAMIHHVYDRVRECNDIDRVVIATDHRKIAEYCDSKGLQYEMTREDHLSGTDRVAEVSERYPEYDIVVNVQGDEPMIAPTQITELVQRMQLGADIATQCVRILDADALFDYNVVKVASNLRGDALYFSRQAIPALRDEPYQQWMHHVDYYQHVGIYAYQRYILHEIVQLQPSRMEQAESLEQLRWLEHGYNITVVETKHRSIGVDTAEDLAYVRELYQNI